MQIARLREGHGMGQASTCAKLHGTNSENHDDFSRSPSYVRRIGQRTSEASDI